MPKISNDPATLTRNHGFSFVGSNNEVVLSRVINYVIAANCMYRLVYAFGSRGVLYRGDVPGLTLLMLSDPTLIVISNRELQVWDLDSKLVVPALDFDGDGAPLISYG